MNQLFIGILNIKEIFWAAFGYDNIKIFEYYCEYIALLCKRSLVNGMITSRLSILLINNIFSYDMAIIEFMIYRLW